MVNGQWSTRSHSPPLKGRGRGGVCLPVAAAVVVGAAALVVVVVAAVILIAVVHELAVDDLLGHAELVEDHHLLEADVLLQHAAGDVVLGGTLGLEADVEALDVVTDVVAHRALGALRLHGGVEGSQAVELHGHAGGEQLHHTVAEGGQHADDGVAGVGAAVAEDVVAQAAQAQRVGAYHPGEPEQVGVVVSVVQLTKIVLHRKLIVCHNFWQQYSS